MDNRLTHEFHSDAGSLNYARRASEKAHLDEALDEALRSTFPTSDPITISFTSRFRDVLRGNYAKQKELQKELIMDTSLKPVAETTRAKSWAVMNGREKTIFVAKLCVMFASFGWIYGNTLAPDEVKP
jgi:hypothetical protein